MDIFGFLWILQPIFIIWLVEASESFIGNSKSTHTTKKGNFMYYLPGSEIELPCYRDHHDEDITDCTWTRANHGDFSRDSLETASHQNRYPKKGNTECSLLLRPNVYQVWNCSYTSSEQHYDGNSYIVKEGEELTQPILSFHGRPVERQISIKAGTPISLNCSVRASPPALISFNTFAPVLDEVGVDNIRNILLKPQKNNNGHSVTCSARQKEYPQIPSKQVTIVLNVLFRPVSSSTKFTHIGDILRITFLFESNPAPQNATWRFSKPSSYIKESINKEVRYTATDVKIKSGIYSGSLTIADPTVKDFETCFYLTVRNIVGERTFETCTISGFATQSVKIEQLLILLVIASELVYHHLI